MPISKDKTHKIKAEEKRISALFENCTENERDYLSKQIQQLAWLNVSIRELQIEIDKTGSTVEYMNGANQYGIRKNPDIETLVQYQKLATTITTATPSPSITTTTPMVVRRATTSSPTSTFS